MLTYVPKWMVATVARGLRSDELESNVLKLTVSTRTGSGAGTANTVLNAARVKLVKTKPTLPITGSGQGATTSVAKLLHAGEGVVIT